MSPNGTLSCGSSEGGGRAPYARPGPQRCTRRFMYSTVLYMAVWVVLRYMSMAAHIIYDGQRGRIGIVNESMRTAAEACGNDC